MNEMYISCHDEKKYQNMLDSAQIKIDDHIDKSQIEGVKRRQKMLADMHERENSTLTKNNLTIATRIFSAHTVYPISEALKHATKSTMEMNRMSAVREKVKMAELRMIERDNVKILRRIQSVPCNYDRKMVAKELSYVQRQSDAHGRMHQIVQQLEDRRREIENLQIAKRLATVPAKYNHETMIREMAVIHNNERYKTRIKEKMKLFDERRLNSDNLEIAKRIRSAKSNLNYDVNKKSQDSKDFSKKLREETMEQDQKVISRLNDELNKRLENAKTSYPIREFVDEYTLMRANATKSARFPNKEVLEEDKKRMAANKKRRNEEIKISREKMEKARKRYEMKRRALMKLDVLSGFKQATDGNDVFNKKESKMKGSAKLTSHGESELGHSLDLTNKCDSKVYKNNCTIDDVEIEVAKDAGNTVGDIDEVLVYPLKDDAAMNPIDKSINDKLAIPHQSDNDNEDYNENMVRGVINDVLDDFITKRENSKKVQPTQIDIDIATDENANNLNDIESGEKYDCQSNNENLAEINYLDNTVNGYEINVVRKYDATNSEINKSERENVDFGSKTHEDIDHNTTDDSTLVVNHKFVVNTKSDNSEWSEDDDNINKIDARETNYTKEPAYETDNHITVKCDDVTSVDIDREYDSEYDSSSENSDDGSSYTKHVREEEHHEIAINTDTINEKSIVEYV